MRLLNNLEVAKVLIGHPEAIKAYDDNDYIVYEIRSFYDPCDCVTYGYYRILSNAGVALTGTIDQDDLIKWFLDLAIENTSNDWEVLADV